MWVTFWPLQKKNPHLRFDHYKKNNSFSFWSLQKKNSFTFWSLQAKLICVQVITKKNSFAFWSLKKKKTHLRFGHNKKKKLICVLVLTKKKTRLRGNRFSSWLLQLLLTISIFYDFLYVILNDIILIIASLLAMFYRVNFYT